MRRCPHKWGIVGMDYQPPVGRSVEVSAVRPEVFERLVHGCTTVSLECEKCGDVSARLVVGRFLHKSIPDIRV